MPKTLMNGDVLAIDIGGTKIRAGRVREGEVVDAVVIPTAPAASESVLDRITELASRFSGIERVGVAAAGVIVDGRVTHATDLIPNWAGSDIVSRLCETLGVPVAVLGDAHAHGLGEATFGAGRRLESILTVAVGTGIGGAVVEHGAPTRGSHGVAGHIGHVLHPASAQLICSCGRVGHIEALASGPGIAEEFGRRNGGTHSGREVAELAAAGDPRAIEVLQYTAAALGEVIGSLANVIDPSLVVLSGSVSAAGDRWWDALRRGYRASAMDAVARVNLVPGELGDHAPLLGAAAFASQLEEQPC